METRWSRSVLKKELRFNCPLWINIIDRNLTFQRNLQTCKCFVHGVIFYVQIWTNMLYEKWMWKCKEN